MRKPIALITGASRGIGRDIARRLARDGHRVVLSDHHDQAKILDTTVKELKESGADAFAVVADVTIEKEVKEVIHNTKELGGLDVMVANAGIVISKPFIECTLEDYQKLLSVNVLGTFLSYSYAARLMVEQRRGGRIIGAASLAGQQGWPLISLYSSSKFAVRGLTQSLAKELAPHGVTVNVYAPGPVETQMMKILEDGADQYSPSKEASEQARASLIPPVGRYATPQEVAGLVSYLASKDAAHVTGQTIGINGGMLGN